MNKTTKTVLIAVVTALIAAGAFVYFTTPEDRTVEEKIEDAANTLDRGVDDAARQLEDRSPAEKVRDGIKDASE